MKSENEIKNYILSLKDELKDPKRDEIDQENIQDEINTLNWVLKNE